MIALLTLRAARDTAEDEIMRWFQAAREIALEVSGVYDLALCDSDGPSSGGLCCVLDVEDESALSMFWEDPHVQRALQEAKQQGLELVLQARWRRLA